MLDEKDLHAIGQMFTEQKKDMLGDVKGLFAEQKKDMMGDVKGLLAEQKKDMMGDVKGLLAEQKKDIMGDVKGLLAEQKNDIMGDVKGLFAEQKKEILVETTYNMKILLENVVTPKFNLLAENQQSILEKLVPRARVDELEDEVKFLKVIVRQMNEDIQNLKTAN